MSNIPNEFYCPITLDIMNEPYTGDDGHTYEKEEIINWLTNNQSKSPMTRQYMQISTLRPNYALKSQIERFLSQNDIKSDLTITKFENESLNIVCTKNDGLFHINVEPPKVGSRKPIVLIVILDNSGSMDSPACDVTETNGLVFTRMDLCKHTLRTIASMLNDNDILSVVTFSTTARVVMKPTNMNDTGKSKLEKLIPNIKPDSQTNIWDGIKVANKIANKPEFNDSNVVCVLLTDGIPNVDPPRGIVQSYKMINKPENLSTFGFGYQLDSRLLNDISNVGNGIFGFIPDYSMVATVFINWTASVLATCSKNQKITILYMDDSFDEINPGLIQYGQSKDIIFEITKEIKKVTVSGKDYNIEDKPINEFNLAHYDLIKSINNAIFNRGENNFKEIYNKYKTSTNSQVIELIRDIKPFGDDEGQVHMAPKYFEKWGKHYLRAFYQAQKNQICMNFKDPGLQIYGGDLFHQIQAEGDDMFCKLPPLEPTGKTNMNSYSTPASVVSVSTSTINMASVFHNPSGGCFQGNCPVIMSNNETKEIQYIKSGEFVNTPSGPAKVIAVVVCGSKLKAQPMCKLTENLWITPWHPVIYKGKWEFPSNIVPMVDRQLNTVYNLVLDKGHIINIDGFDCVTLGHSFKEDKVKHDFFGSQKVIKSLMKCPGWKEGRPVFKNLKAIKENDIIIDWIDDI